MAFERRIAISTGFHWQGECFAIVEFYSNRKTDCSGRYLSEIVKWDHKQLEHCHNYIQWLFPTAHRSAYNFFSPVLDPIQREIFQQSFALQDEVRRSFSVMSEFYGFELGGNDEVRLGKHFSTRASNWLTPHNHNYLRLSRMIISLRSVGLAALSSSLGNQLVELAEIHPEIGEVTAVIWKNVSRSSPSAGEAIC